MSYDGQDPGEELHGALRRTLSFEPPMAAQPSDDLARGQRLLRRRRVGSVVAAAAAVPAVALVASTLPGATSPEPMEAPFASAPTTADEPTDDDSVMGDLAAVCVSAESGTRAGGGDFGSDGGKAATRGTPAQTRPGTAAQVRPDRGPALGQLLGGKGHDSLGGGSGGEMGSLVPLDGTEECEAVPGEPMEVEEIDRLEQALTESLDPSGDYLTMSMAGVAGSSVEAGAADAGVSSVSVSAEWADGDRVGGVDLTVAGAKSYADEPGAAPCADPSLFGGPELTCEERQLADGSTVLVGTGERAGVRLVTVRFDRDDGDVVWATADQASDAWWDGQSGAEPLTELPTTVEQLIDLAQDPRVHL